MGPLLLPDQVGGRKLSELASAKRLADDTIDGVECVVVEGRLLNAATTVWVDKATGLVHRVDRHFRSETFTSDESITYAPKVDAEVPTDRLALPALAGSSDKGKATR